MAKYAHNHCTSLVSVPSPFGNFFEIFDLGLNLEPHLDAFERLPNFVLWEVLQATPPLENRHPFTTTILSSLSQIVMPLMYHPVEIRHEELMLEPLFHHPPQKESTLWSVNNNIDPSTWLNPDIFTPNIPVSPFVGQASMVNTGICIRLPNERGNRIQKSPEIVNVVGKKENSDRWSQCPAPSSLNLSSSIVGPSFTKNS